MATNFIALTNKQKGFLIKKWIQNPKSLFGVGNYNVDEIGTIVNLDNVPTEDEFELFKGELVSRGVLDPFVKRALQIYIEDELGALAVNADLTLTPKQSGELLAVGLRGEAYRKLGFREEEIHNTLVNTAITNPKNFLKDKAADIEHINGLAFKAYQDAYNKYREFGYADNEAFDKAKSAATGYKNELMKTHNKQYSEKLSSDAKGRIGQIIT